MDRDASDACRADALFRAALHAGAFRKIVVFAAPLVGSARYRRHRFVFGSGDGGSACQCRRAGRALDAGLIAGFARWRQRREYQTARRLVLFGKSLVIRDRDHRQGHGRNECNEKSVFHLDAPDKFRRIACNFILRNSVS